MERVGSGLSNNLYPFNGMSVIQRVTDALFAIVGDVRTVEERTYRLALERPYVAVVGSSGTRVRVYRPRRGRVVATTSAVLTRIDVCQDEGPILKDA